MDKKQILIIEDDKFFRELVAKRLRLEDLDVLTAENSKEAFELLNTNVPSIIILDMLLPGLDGFEILTILKKDPKTAGIPVMVLSNLGQKEEIERAKILGATDYMVKINFSLDEITESVHKIIDQR